MHIDLKFLSRRFWADTAGIVTVQMVTFSVLLFGGVGLMMDFGRAYSAHSQMQGFIDQVALAAAQQLDRKDDSITRAAAAASAVSKSSAFLQGNNAFQLHELVFMSDAPTDSNGDFSPSLAATYATTQPELATHVLARAVSSSVSARMLNFGSGGAGGSNGITDIDISASAVARSRTVACGGLSPMVMCNPFETSTSTSWQEQMENGVGYRMKLTADVVSGGKPSNFSGTTPLLRLGLLKSPHNLMEVRNRACSDLNLLPGANTTSKSTETLRDICLLATVETGLSCINDQVAFKGADPEAITTGLDVIFDMYEDSMADVLNPALDVAFPSDFPGSLGYPSFINRSSLFYPDLVPSHGRMNREDYNKFLDDQEAEVNAHPTMPPFLKSSALAAINARRSAYPVDGTIDFGSRYNHIFSVGQRSEWGPVPQEPCLVAENCPFYPVINASAPGVNDVEGYASAYYAPHFLRQIQAANSVTYPNWWDVDPALIDAGPLVNGESTYYGFYSNVERAINDLRQESATDGHKGNGSIALQIPTVSNPNGYGEFGIQAGAVNFPAIYGSNSIGSDERRLQRITVVNCEGAVPYATATGDTSGNFNDSYIGDVVDVIDVHLLTPPQVVSCDNGPASDPEGNNLCANSDITRTDLDVELVDAASMNSVNFDTRFYAVLVH